jgi:ABC-2 type transport system permease protein
MPHEIDSYLDKGKARVALSIPADFSRDLRAGRAARLEIIVDVSDSNTATIALGYLTALTERYSLKLSRGRAAPAIDPRIRVWYNPELKSRNFIIPGLIAVIMVVIAALLTSLTVAREWERGPWASSATPVKPRNWSSAHPAIGYLDMAITVVMAVFLFEVPLRGNVALLAVISAVFLFGGLSLGILISIVTKNQLVASQISMVATFLPAFLLGVMFYRTLPPRTQYASHFSKAAL